MVVKIDNVEEAVAVGPVVKKTKQKKLFTKQFMLKVFHEALEQYDRITKDLPDSFKNKKSVDEYEDQVELKTLPLNKKIFKLGNAPRAKTIKELEERLKCLKGKSGYTASLVKKGLKNRLKKKQKLEERQEMKRLKIANKGNKVKSVKFEVEEIKPEAEKAEVVFNKFDFDEEQDTKPVVKKSPKDPKAILHQIEKSKKKLKSLEERGHKDKVVEIKTKQAWDKAIQQAEGVKIKDDVELLKKSIAKKKQQKARSAKKWDSRLEATEQKKTDAQKKRKENLTAKKKDKKQKKIKKSIKKGRVVL